jgi:hypothetical protein
LTLRKANNVIVATGRRAGREITDAVVWVHDARPLVPVLASLLRWWIKPLYAASAFLAFFPFTRGFAWLLLLVARWAAGRYYGVSVIDYSEL